ncbi:hypothetical protein ACNI65_16560 [Roseateles sp. So40a]|uniref:hypothetical protein n=1 Tax=Roseateles sp. So40a TaxID=3400226 RepID=UPI003A846923
MNLFSCLPRFAAKAHAASGPADVPTSGPMNDPNDRAHRERITTQLSGCRKLASRHPDARIREELSALLGRAQDRFTQPPPDYGDASRQIEVEEVRAYKLQRDLAPLLERIAPKLADEEIPLESRIDAATGIAVVLGDWCLYEPIQSALQAVHDMIPAPDRHRAVRQAVANGDAKGLAARLDDLQRRRPRPDPRELLRQTLRGDRDENPTVTLLTHAVMHGNAEVAEVLTRKLVSLRLARVIDARDQINYLKQALQPEVLHRAASSAHVALGVRACVDAMCMDKGLQATLRRAMPSIMTATIQASDSPEGFSSLISQMSQTRQGRAVAAHALEDLSRGGVFTRLCRGDASVQALDAYLRGLTVAARTGAVSGKALGRLLLTPGPTGRPAIADARGQLRASMRRMLDNIEPHRLLGAQDLRLLRAAVGPA